MYNKYNNNGSSGNKGSYRPKNGYGGGGGRTEQKRKQYSPRSDSGGNSNRDSDRDYNNNERSDNNDNDTKLKTCFTIILDSETPQYIIDDLVDTDVLSDLENMGLWLRIGVPELGGIDTKAIRDKYKNNMFIIPWKGFNDVNQAYCFTTEDAKGIYKANSLSDLTDAILTIASVKVNLLLGESCDNPSIFLMTWTTDGAETVRDLSKETGYLAALIKLAGTQNIKVLNLNNATAWEQSSVLAERALRTK